MKILHVAYFGRFGKVTGIGEAVMNLVHHQQELGHQVQILIPFNHPFVDKVTVHYARSFSHAIANIKRFSPDIVVFDGLYDKYQIRLSFYLKVKHIPYILVFHGGASADNAKKNWIKKKVANWLLFNRFVKWAERVVYLSANERAKSVFTRQNSMSAIIPNGVNLPENITMGDMADRIRIVFLSRLDWYGKGLDVLCDAMKLLSQKKIDDKVQFVFYGPKESAECERLFDFGNFSIYGGYVTGEEKNKAFQNADIFILPSRSEGMPVAVLEALSYGVPCIVTPETNMAELVENNHCGWVVYLSATDICNTIEKIIVQFSCEREHLFKNAIATAQLFDWREVAKKSIRMYEEVIVSKKGYGNG